MPMRAGWAVLGLFCLLFVACGNDDESPPAHAGGAGGSTAGTRGGNEGGNDGGDGNGGTVAGSSGATSGAAGSSGFGGNAGTAGDAGASGADDGGGAGIGGADDVLGTRGGTISDADGNLTLIIPAGALLGDTRFTFTDVAAPNGLPSDLDFVEGSGHRVDWNLAGFAPDASLSARIRVPDAMFPAGSDELAVPLPFCMAVQCADGTWATSDCVLINGGTLEQDVAPVCLEGARSLTFAVTNPNDTALPPEITTQPAGISVGTGDPAAFSVVATGSPPPSYQWRRNGADIPGATSSNYTLSATYPSDTGARFSVRVSNRHGTVTSNEAVLTVGPPRTPTWSTPIPLNAFATGVDLPQTGSLAGLDFVVWNEAGTLHAKVAGAGSYAPIDTLAEPSRGRPQVVTAGNTNAGFIAFVDDSGSSCPSAQGNRLSAVALRIGSEGQVYPRSSRFTLYESPTECVGQFSVGWIDTDFATARPLAFAVTEAGTGALRVGAGGAIYDDARSTWSVTAPVLTPLTLDAGCSGGAFITNESLAGRRQTFPAGSVPTTTGVLTWVANENLCAATLDGGTWSRGSVVFDSAIGDPSIGPPEPVAAIDSDGKTLVAASRVTSPTAIPPTQAMTAAFRAASGGAWDVDALDASAAQALPSAAFTTASSTRPESSQFTGSALVVWRPSLSAPPTTIYAAVRSPSGVWTSAQPISAAAAADTRFPRVCVDSVGNAVALYAEKASASDPFQVWARLWSGGAWSAPGRVQNDANEGRFADCVRHEANPFLRDGVFVAWRETNPSDSTQFRIVTATR
jgi:hypothetical protein